MSKSALQAIARQNAGDLPVLDDGLTGPRPVGAYEFQGLWLLDGSIIAADAALVGSVSFANGLAFDNNGRLVLSLDGTIDHYHQGLPYDVLGLTTAVDSGGPNYYDQGLVFGPGGGITITGPTTTPAVAAYDFTQVNLDDAIIDMASTFMRGQTDCASSHNIDQTDGTVVPFPSETTPFVVGRGAVIEGLDSITDFPYSENLAIGFWSKQNLTATNDFYISPRGDLTAAKITIGATPVTQSCRIWDAVPVTIGQRLKRIFWLEAKSVSEVGYIYCDGDMTGGSNASISYDLATGDVTDFGGGNASMKVTNYSGLLKFEMEYDIGATGNATQFIYFANNNNGNTGANPGYAGGDEFLLWGMNGGGSFNGSYILANGAASQRDAADFSIATSDAFVDNNVFTGNWGVGDFVLGVDTNNDTITFDGAPGGKYNGDVKPEWVASRLFKALNGSNLEILSRGVTTFVYDKLTNFITGVPTTDSEVQTGFQYEAGNTNTYQIDFSRGTYDLAGMKALRALGGDAGPWNDYPGNDYKANLTIIPLILQNGDLIYESYTDANNYDLMYMTNTDIVYRCVNAGVIQDTTLAITGGMLLEEQYDIELTRDASAGTTLTVNHTGGTDTITNGAATQNTVWASKIDFGRQQSGIAANTNIELCCFTVQPQ